MGNDSIDFSLTNIWRSWYKFKVGKKRTRNLEIFTYYLENNLFDIYKELNKKSYRHGAYCFFTTTDNKRRKISVAGIKDRIIHRLAYEYLVVIFDKSFQYDAWSCRKNKGLLGAIERTQQFARAYQNCYVWRADIKKFFDNVDHRVLLRALKRKINDDNAFWLLCEIIASFGQDNSRERERESKRPADRQFDQPDFRQYLFKRARPFCKTHTEAKSLSALRR